MFTSLVQMPGPESLPQNLIAAAVLLQVLFGLASCFFGYRIFTILLGLMGFAAGAALGGMIGYELSSGEGSLMLVGGVVGALVGAVLFAYLYYIGVFVIGAALGAVLTSGGAAVAHVQELSLVVLLIAAVAGGVVALVLQKLAIVLSTALSGAWFAIVGALYLLGRPLPPAELVLTQGDRLDVQHLLQQLRAQLDAPVLFCWLLLAAAGIVVQYLTPRRARPGPAPAAQPPQPSATSPKKP